MEKIKKIQAVIARISLILAAIGMAAIAVAVFYAVLSRYVLKTNSIWVEQFTRYVLIWVVFIASNVLIYRNDLMRVDFADGLWPKAFLKIREGFYSVLFVIILGTLCWQGWLQAESYIGVAVVGLPIDKFWIYLSVPVGAALMMIQYLLHLLVLFMQKKGGEMTL